MFKPNQLCIVHLASNQTDVFGMPTPGIKVKERCSVVKMKISNIKSAVRADTSASRGNAQEIESDTVILLARTTRAGIDDNIEIHGNQFRIMSIHPRFTVVGDLDHYEVGCTYWASE